MIIEYKLYYYRLKVRICVHSLKPSTVYNFDKFLLMYEHKQNGKQRSPYLSKNGWRIFRKKDREIKLRKKSRKGKKRSQLMELIKIRFLIHGAEGGLSHPNLQE